MEHLFVGLKRANRLLNKFFMIAGGVAVLALMSLATGNVMLRIFRLPYSGAYELISFLGAVVIASALGYTQMRHDHIIVDIITERYSEKAAEVVEGLAGLVMAIFFVLVAWQVWVWGVKIQVSGEVSETLKVVYHPYVFFLSAGFAAAALTALLDCVRDLLLYAGVLKK
ncbi:MAG TPA: TRAP transporter small permease subunit [Syntrophales bacterium]|nr:TRAP transporter small permease subunit [Syntrophales bacterium]HOX95706.1 TRAP transporter small permease subunit [Syntrophales bacterium]HPI56919.1 TRAP transporter small permease subunit [Syntrophales bacterium]HPN23505.1 TRAP transporter small permease subunit [Syntrophales bacterium]HQM27970.1 TRAP transporter small permease subunit [Syntrophales bacterium]